MKHLVIGSSGQIGSSLVNYLINQNEEVIKFDIKDNPLEDLRIKNNSILIEKIKQCDIVHFLAFDVGGAKYLEMYQNSYSFIDNNLKIMSNTFELLKFYNKPFIFASSQMSELSHSTYGMLKSIGEKVTRDLGGIVIRLWNVYGYEPYSEKSHAITDFIKMAKYESKINLRTDGQEARQLLYSDDCSECILILSKKYHILDKSKSYHITSFEWVKILDVAKIVQTISGCEINTAIRKDETQKNAMNNADSYILNFWKPKTTLEEGIKKLYKLY
jgi:nucleoside-diphosphate-sugar epimerase